MRKNAIGLIETQGLVAAVEALDTCLKAAQVDFAARWYPSGGLVCIIVSGDVGAVKAAVHAGKVAAEKIGEVVGVHVIPRPTDNTWDIVLPVKKYEQVCDNVKITQAKLEDEENDDLEEDDVSEDDKDDDKISEDILEEATIQLKNMFQDTKTEALIEEEKRLDQYGVRKLRKILRSLPAEDIDKSRISIMRKKELLEIIVDCILKGERE